MILTLGGVLEPKIVQRIRANASELDWHDGAETAGAVAKRVKSNEQADLTSKPGGLLHKQLLSTIENHVVLRAATRPKKFSRLLLSRTREGGGYGRHIDNALMGRGASRLRTDISFTLFLSNPGDYEGGDLVVDQAGSEQSFKLVAGDLLLYPATTLHRVNPVTSGERLVCIGWIESFVRDLGQRELLFDLENLRTELRRKLPLDGAELLTLDKTIANLMRRWCDT